MLGIRGDLEWTRFHSALSLPAIKDPLRRDLEIPSSTAPNTFWQGYRHSPLPGTSRAPIVLREAVDYIVTSTIFSSKKTGTHKMNAVSKRIYFKDNTHPPRTLGCGGLAQTYMYISVEGAQWVLSCLRPRSWAPSSIGFVRSRRSCTPPPRGLRGSWRW